MEAGPKVIGVTKAVGGPTTKTIKGIGATKAIGVLNNQTLKSKDDKHLQRIHPAFNNNGGHKEHPQGTT